MYSVGGRSVRRMAEAMTMSRKVPFIIGVAGGTASGKSSVCARIMERIGRQHQRNVITLGQDSFYRQLIGPEKKLAEMGQFNFDHPDALEHSLMLQVLRDLSAGNKVSVPKYDFRTNSRVLNSEEELSPADVILVEGILIFYDAELRSLFDMKLFVDTDPDIRLARRVERDIMERGRSLTQVLNQYLRFVKPAFEEFCLPTKKYADVIIPRGAENDVAIDLIVQHIQDLVRSPRNSLVNGHRSTEAPPPRMNGSTEVPPLRLNGSAHSPTPYSPIGPVSRPH